MTRGTVPTPPRTPFASFVSRAVCASISLLLELISRSIQYPISSLYPIPATMRRKRISTLRRWSIHDLSPREAIRDSPRSPRNIESNILSDRESNRSIVDFFRFFRYFRGYYFSIGKKKGEGGFLEELEEIDL